MVSSHRFPYCDCSMNENKACAFNHIFTKYNDEHSYMDSYMNLFPLSLF